jgi:hypothetical protein
MKTKIIYFFILQLNFFILNGQGPYSHEDPFSKGYIIVKNDTIYCMVKNNNQFIDEDVVKYKLTKDSKVQKIAIKDVTEVFDNSFIYEKIVDDGYYYLVKQIINGPVSLYEIDNSKEISGWTPNGSGGYNSGPTITTIYGSILYLKRSDKFVKIKRKTFKEDIKSVLTDNPETSKKVDELVYKDVYIFIQALVNNYNKCLINKDK